MYRTTDGWGEHGWDSLSWADDRLSPWPWTTSRHQPVVRKRRVVKAVPCARRRLAGSTVPRICWCWRGSRQYVNVLPCISAQRIPADSCTVYGRSSTMELMRRSLGMDAVSPSPWRRLGRSSLPTRAVVFPLTSSRAPGSVASRWFTPSCTRAENSVVGRITSQGDCMASALQSSTPSQRAWMWRWIASPRCGG